MRAVTLSLLFFCAAFAPAADDLVFRPKETGDVLVNPGMGLQTFECFLDNPSVKSSVKERLDSSSLPFEPWDQKNSPGSTIAYFRYRWRDLEPEEGVYNFLGIEKDLAHARRCGQQLAVAVAPYGRPFTRTGRGKNAGVEVNDTALSYTPEWFLKKHKGRTVAAPGNPSMTNWEIEFNDPYYLDKQCEFVRALAQKLNGHPDLCFADLRSLGYWGEWHTWTKDGEWLEEKSWKRIIDLYTTVFDKTPLVIPIQANEMNALPYAVRKGVGWRYDGLGWPTPATFPELLKRQGVEDAWKRGPVTFETGPQTINDKCDFQFDRKTFELLLQLHVSSLHTLTLLPAKEEGRRELNAFLKKCGYRFVIRSLTTPGVLKPGTRNRISVALENGGVAPAYRQYVFAIKLEQEGDPSAIVVHRSASDARAWLPGPHTLAEDVLLPEATKPGLYHLSVALLNPSEAKPAVKFAVEGRQPDGWCRIGDIRVGGAR